MALKQKTKKQVLIEIVSTKFSATVTTDESKAVAYLKSARKYMEKIRAENVKVKTTLITTLVPVIVKGLDGTAYSFKTIELAQAWILGAASVLRSLEIKYDFQIKAGGRRPENGIEYLSKQLDKFRK